MYSDITITSEKPFIPICPEDLRLVKIARYSFFPSVQKCTPGTKTVITWIKDKTGFSRVVFHLYPTFFLKPCVNHKLKPLLTNELAVN